MQLLRNLYQGQKAAVRIAGAISEWFRVYTGMWSQSRCLGLETVSRRTNVLSRSRLGQSAQRLSLVSVSDLCISGLVSVSTQKVSASRLGSFHLVGGPCVTSVLQ